jgi:hypothetical protein
MRRVFVAIACVVALAGCNAWGQLGHDAGHTAWNPFETSLTPANVGSLQFSWRSNPSTGAPRGPVIADGYLFELENSGTLAAFDPHRSAACTGAPTTCLPVWIASLGFSSGSGYPAVADHKVYVVSKGFDGWNLNVFDARGITNCAGTPKSCGPLWAAKWPAAPNSLNDESSVVVADGKVAVAAGSEPEVVVFDAAGVANCTTGQVVSCSPLYRAPTPARTRPTTPTMTGGHLFVPAGDGTVAVFDDSGAGCPTGVCTRQYSLATSGAVSVSAARAYAVGANGDLEAFDANGVSNCTAQVCSPLWTGTTSGFALQSAPVVADGRVYVVGGLIEAFSASGAEGCTGTPVVCAPLMRYNIGTFVDGVAATRDLLLVVWHSPAFPPSPFSAGVSAFDLDGGVGCSGAPKSCSTLWTGNLPNDQYYLSAPAVADGVVAVTAIGDLSVFALP